MSETVRVTMAQRQGVRMSKQEPITYYGPGRVEMPIEHAQTLGILNQLIRDENDPFAGVFSGSVSRALSEAGHTSVDDLRAMDRGELKKIKGIGDAAANEIEGVLRGGA